MPARRYVDAPIGSWDERQVTGERPRRHKYGQRRDVCMPAAVDISGERYGRLVAVEFAGHLRKGSQPKRAFRFRCDCGAEVVKTLMDVRRAATVSCGCHKRELARAWGERSRLAEGESSFRALYNTYKKRALKDGRAFSLTKEQFRALTSAPCTYCNIKPRQQKRACSESYGIYQYNGLDRVDNARGYELGNVAPCCAMCNRSKRELSVVEFLDWVRRVYRWRCED